MATPPRPAGVNVGDERRGLAVPPTMVVALAVVLLESAALLLTALWFVVALVRDGSSSVGVALFLVVFVVGVAGLLGAAARSLHGGGRGGRAPVLGWQVLQGATAVAVLQVRGAGSIALWVAGASLAAAAVVVVMLLTPSAVRFTTTR